jgi:hypothetical protein
MMNYDTTDLWITDGGFMQTMIDFLADQADGFADYADSIANRISENL